MKRHILIYERKGEDWEEFFVVDEEGDSFTAMITGCRPKEGAGAEALGRRPVDMHVTSSQALRDLKILVFKPAQDLFQEGKVDKLRLITDEEPTDEIPMIEVNHHG